MGKFSRHRWRAEANVIDVEEERTDAETAAVARAVILPEIADGQNAGRDDNAEIRRRFGRRKPAVVRRIGSPAPTVTAIHWHRSEVIHFVPEVKVVTNERRLASPPVSRHRFEDAAEDGGVGDRSVA